MKYQRFVFKDYDFDRGAKTLELTYGMDDALEFKETYKFDFVFAPYDQNALDRALQNLFFIAGVSYYKTYIPPQIVVERGKLDPELARFFSKTYQRGLGEFWYVNKLDPQTPVSFPADATKSQIFTPGHQGEGLLASVGGG
jgi:UDP-N-acetyl-alpha-D-muramoyl-L-alanyl-L-glutamate epimerase